MSLATYDYAGETFIEVNDSDGARMSINPRDIVAFGEEGPESTWIHLRDDDADIIVLEEYEQIKHTIMMLNEG